MLPFMMAMFENAAQHIKWLCKIYSEYFLSHPAAVHHWSIFGMFLGSHVGEYGQTKARHGTFNAVPNMVNAGKWGGQPLAFIQSELTFWTNDGVQIDSTNLKRILKEASNVWVRFWYDKFRNNHIIWKFYCMGHFFLCPMKAAISILL
jgi:hypothetical protein